MRQSGEISGGGPGIGLLVIGVALAAAGCTDRRFDTQATYRAPVGGFDVSIHATGVVHAGDDLASSSTADVHVAPLPSGHAIDVRLSLPRTADAPDVADLIRHSGPAATRAELEEVNHVIELALFGNKATLVEGQTKALQVVAVHFR